MTSEHMPLSRHRIRHTSIADKISGSVRRMILLGELESGTRLTHDRLSVDLGVSTMPVREALLRLAAEGFVHNLPNRSFVVAPLSREDLEAVFWIQSLVAAELSRRACQKADSMFLKRLELCQSQFDSARRAGDRESMESANWAFHREINTTAASSRLLMVLRTTLHYTPEGLYSRIDAWAGETEQGHHAILEAFRSRNSEAVAVEAAQHVVRAGKLLITSPHVSQRLPDLSQIVDAGRASAP
jgi:DNA-binding GntR family transcriptional regulator